MEWIAELRKLFDAACVNADAYKPHLLQMEAVLNEHKNIYNYKPESIMLNMCEPADIRLQRAKEKLAKVQQNPSIGMQELLESVFRNFRDWVSENQLGYVAEFDLLQNGIARVKVSARTFMHNTYSDELKEERYRKQIANLNSKGFNLYKSKFGDEFVFADTDNNRKLLEEAFAIFQIGKMDFTTNNLMSKEGRAIRHYSFQVDPLCLLSINTHKPIKNGLNKDDFTELHRELNNFVDAIHTIKAYPDLKDTCIGCMEGQLAHICRQLNIETETSKQYFNQYADERAKNQQIREIEAQIAKCANFNDLGKIIAERFQPIEEIMNQTGFYMDEFYINIYGCATFHIKPSHIGCEKFENFETFSSDARMSDAEILDNEHNKKALNNLFFLCQLQGLEIKTRDNIRYIAGVTYQIPNLL